MALLLFTILSPNFEVIWMRCSLYCGFATSRFPSHIFVPHGHHHCFVSELFELIFMVRAHFDVRFTNVEATLVTNPILILRMK